MTTNNINLAEIKERLLSEAKKRAEEMILNAEKEAEKIIRKAESEWLSKYQEYKNKEIKRIVEKSAQIESEAKMKARILVSQAKIDVVEKLFEDALDRIDKREIDIKKSLENLLDSALKEISSIKKIIVSPRDVETLKEILKERKLDEVVIEENPRMIGGLVVESTDGIVIDNSYETRLSLIKDRFASVIREILWGENK